MKLRSPLNRRSRSRWCHRLLLGLGWCAFTLASVARADEPRILVISEPNVPSKVEDSVVDGLDGIGIVGKSDEYLAAARAQRLAPTSDAALTRIATRARARLIVALTVEKKKLQVSYRDGSSGAVVAKQKFSARSPKALPSRTLKKMTATARRALSKLRSAPVEPASSSFERESAPLQRDSGPPPSRTYQAAPIRNYQQPPAAAVARTAEPASPPPAAVEPEPEPEPEPESETSTAEADVASEASDDNKAEDTAPSKRDPDGLRILASIGTGVGQRAIHVPGRFGGSTLDTGIGFPAFEARLGAQGMLNSEWFLAGEAYYRTVIGLKALDTTAPAAVSSQHIVVGLAPGLRFDGPDSADLRLFVGFAYRSLSPQKPVLATSTIYGAMLRPELRLPLFERFTLRIAPELIVAFGVDTLFRAMAIPGLAGIGFGVGGEVSLDVSVAGPLSVGLEYRESHLLVGSNVGTAFDDLERFVIVRAIFQL